MSPTSLTKYQLSQRSSWVKRISELSGNFEADSARIESDMDREIVADGIESVIGHLRTCGAIPESFTYDSSEEKLYSKYTEFVLAKSFESIGLSSVVLTERADSADVECVAGDYSFVADAKAFRLSRTAKNQKDFKIEALDSWKHGRPYAMVVCPVYQLPYRTSQIYFQAITRSVCVFSYTHLAVLVRYANSAGSRPCIALLRGVFEQVEALNPSKDAQHYWRALNSLMMDRGSVVRDFWLDEKRSSAESIAHAKDEALTHLAMERDRIMRLSKREAIREILKIRRIEAKDKVIRSVADNGLLHVE